MLGLSHGCTLKTSPMSWRVLDLLYLSMSFPWWQAVAGIREGKSRNVLRMHSRCAWRHSEGARPLSNTAIRGALSPLHPCGSVTADVHGCPRGVAPLRHPLAIGDDPVAHMGGETPRSPHHAS
jgi:hypothetical protein